MCVHMQAHLDSNHNVTINFFSIQGHKHMLLYSTGTTDTCYLNVIMVIVELSNALCD